MSHAPNTTSAEFLLAQPNKPLCNKREREWCWRVLDTTCQRRLLLLSNRVSLLLKLLIRLTVATYCPPALATPRSRDYQSGGRGGGSSHLLVQWTSEWPLCVSVCWSPPPPSSSSDTAVATCGRPRDCSCESLREFQFQLLSIKNLRRPIRRRCFH